MTVSAIYQDGVFRPMEPVNLPENTVVEFELRIRDGQTPAATPTDGLQKIYAILGERYASGHPDTAARHNEHQP